MKEGGEKFDKSVDFRPIYFSDCRIISGANVKSNRLIFQLKVPSRFQQHRGTLDPDVQEETPEFVVESGRIFQPKYENVSGQNHRIQEEQNGCDDRVSGDDLDVANEYWKRSDDEPEGVGDLDEDDELDAAPAADRGEHVEQSPSGVAAVFFEPNYSEVKCWTDYNAEKRNCQTDDLCAVVFHQKMKKVSVVSEGQIT